ncbi:histone acetyltransferase [Malassezia vespertilionis]|uniref:histone acetyltransferase n=1 Tax=Malassezia vespertilionis TaxID=2020962 RepID=A0A2N1JAN7_9BASI|nr:histone acetyltransferase [Malassezia vespertilionis]PKI83611.1 Esa1p [Malassezia vespertilionis]WFD07242.1 histone acetyltransferase [Malassezia vespertilionis]
MAPKANTAGDAEPPKISAGGTYTLEQITVGARVYVEKTNPDNGDVEQRQAEVLSIREKRQNRLHLLQKMQEKGEELEEDAPEIDFYVHYCEFNKRLDEWVSSARILLSRDMQWPKPPEPSAATKQTKRKVVQGVRSIPGVQNSAAADGEMQDEKVEESFSKEKEVEKLRTSGSMTQCSNEVSRVKNLNMIQMGKHQVESWYFSPYPVEYAHSECLYLCEMCLSYFPSEYLLSRHRRKCAMLYPPGNEIYRSEDISFFEIDGRRQKTWCRNLCLLSKCFLDHKTLYYDVDPFMYYVMCQRDNAGCHMIGYFSKEKESAEGYNVACILTLPQHQRSGFGRLLIEFSYELSKREGKLGSPEKPLSDLGLLGYRAYWTETIVDLLLKTEDEISIDDIASKTSILHADVLQTLQALNMLKQYQGKHYLVLSDAVMEKHERQTKKKRRRIQPEQLNWKPPVFTRDQLRFGW